MRLLGVDIEASGLKGATATIWSLSVFDGKKDLLYHNCNGLKRTEVPQTVKDMLESPKYLKIIHNVPYDVHLLEMQLGIKIVNVADTMARELVIQGIRITKKNTDKKLVAKYNCALENVLPRYGFPKPDKDIRERFIDRRKGIPFNKEEIQYMKDDTHYLPALYIAQEYILKRDNLHELGLLEDLTALKIAGMKTYGVGFDKTYWRKLAEKDLREFNRRLGKLPNTVANWNSEKQVKAYFLKKGIFIDKYKNLEAIQKKANNPVLGNFIHMRELHKNVTTYGMNWFSSEYIDPDGRIRGDFDQSVDTGRMSSSKPNLQNLKRKGPHRGAFVAKKGHSFVIADFEGQEIGIMAAASGEKLWIDALLRGEDVHCLVASMLFQEDWDEGGKRNCTFPAKCKCPDHLELRARAKILNFMLAYGGGAQKFADDTGLDLFEATVVIRRFKKIIPKLTQWLRKNGESAENTGETFSASPYRRRRVLFVKAGRAWGARNQGMNSPIQGAGADMLKLAMVSIPDKYPIALVIHDEIVCEVPDRMVKKALKDVKDIMEQTADYITGIKGLVKVDIRVAKNLLKV